MRLQPACRSPHFSAPSRRPIPAYNSCGLGLTDDLGALADEAEKLLAGGFRAVKLRLGYPTLREDIAAVHAVRKRIGDDATLMVDYNQALSVEEALVRGRALDEEKIYWLEEPIRHDDYVGAARLARELKVPIQIGENFSLPAAMSVALDQGAADYVMPDLERIGGVTGWRQAADIAAAQARSNVVASFPGSERASACRDADLPFPRICRLGERPGRAAARNCPTATQSCRRVPATAWCGTKARSNAIVWADLAQRQLEQLDRVVAADLGASASLISALSNHSAPSLDSPRTASRPRTSRDRRPFRSWHSSAPACRNCPTW